MKTFHLVSTLALLGGGLLTLSALPLYADDDEHEHHEHEGKRAKHALTMANDPSYVEECAACHFAYQPGLLPARSWQKMLGNLSDHFGENAELEVDKQQQLTTYLMENAGDVKPSGIYYELAGRLNKKATPLRISQLPGFVHEHEDIPARVLKNNPDLSSFSQCQQCHTDAKNGSYEEYKVNIPGYGRWDD